MTVRETEALSPFMNAVAAPRDPPSRPEVEFLLEQREVSPAGFLIADLLADSDLDGGAPWPLLASRCVTAGRGS
jgi:hypothetical protein